MTPTLFLIVALGLPVATYGHIRNYCETKGLPLVKAVAERDGGFTILERWQPDDPDQPTDVEEVPPNETGYFYAKECSCFEEQDMYGNATLCPLTTSTCREIINTHWGTFPYPRTTTCYDKNKGQEIFNTTVLSAWLILLALLLLTHRGRSALSYLPAKLFPCWNSVVTTLNLKYRKQFSRRLIRNHILVQEEQWIRRMQREEEAAAEDTPAAVTAIEMATLSVQAPPEQLPISLRLKTTLYRAPSIKEEDPEEDPENGSTNKICTICYEPLQEGQRVGALQCPHVYHVECLKLWLQRRNSCPLCQSPKVAEPLYEGEQEASSTARETTAEEASADIPATMAS